MSMQSGGQRSAQNVSGWTDLKDIKAMLPSMQDCDIVAFFTSFERILQLHEVDKGLWPKLLPSQLSAKAIRAYSRLSLDETKCYETVKRIIWQSYNLTADAYLKSFRGMKRSGASTYKMFLTSLREMMERYMDARKIVTLSDLVQLMFKSSS